MPGEEEHTLTKSEPSRVYVGIDVGGTKIQASAVDSSGKILGREKRQTPRASCPKRIIQEIIRAVESCLLRSGIERENLAGIGLAIPGVVEPDDGYVVVTPNMGLSNTDVVSPIKKRFKVAVALGNDVNLGTLGEKWLGAAQQAASAVGIFVGTGIGGGVIMDHKLVRGSREAAGEIGHMILKPGGPLCGCGYRGCLEALASRTAIEREIKAAIAAGKETMAAQGLEQARGLIRSGVLKKALKAGDAVVTKAVGNASRMLGLACLTVRHLVDPDVIILGGGVMEACGNYVMSIIVKIVSEDPLPGARPGCAIVRSELGDDAVVLGAVALIQEKMGATPIQDTLAKLPKYPSIRHASFGEITVQDKVYKHDLFIRADGEIKRRNKKLAKETVGSSHIVGMEELDKVCKGRPSLLVVGQGMNSMTHLSKEGETFLKRQGVEVELAPNPEAIRLYNKSRLRKALLIHVAC